jgi:hypothetical protein
MMGTNWLRHSALKPTIRASVAKVIARPAL